MHAEELDKLYEYGIKLLDSVGGDMRKQKKMQSELEAQLDASKGKVKEMKSHMEKFLAQFSE